MNRTRFWLIFATIVPMYLWGQNYYASRSGELFQKGYVLYKEKKFDLAIPALKDSYYNDLKFDKSLGYLEVSTDLIAKSYRSLEQYDSAATYFQKTLNVYEELYGKSTKKYLNKMEDLIDVYAHLHDTLSLQITIDSYLSGYKIIESDSLEIFNILIKTARVLFDNKMYAQAIPIQTEILSIYEAQVGKDLNYAAMLSKLAKLYIKELIWDKAEELYEEVWEIRSALLDISDDKCEETLFNLIVIAQSKNDLQKLCSYGKLMTEHCKAKNGYFSHQHAKYLLNVSEWLLQLQKIDEALEYCQLSLAIFKEIYGTKNINYVAATNRLATIYETLGRYDDAIQLLLPIPDIVKEIKGEDSDDHLTIICNLAVAYIGSGDIMTGKNILQEVYDKELTINDGVLLNNLSQAYRDCGEYPKAIEFAQKAIALKKAQSRNVLEPDSYATSLINLAILYEDIGDYPNAIRCCQEALDNFNFLKARGIKKSYSQEYIHAYLTYVTILQQHGNKQERLLAIKEAEYIYDIVKSFPEQSKIYQTVLNTIGLAYCRIDGKEEEGLNILIKLTKLPSLDYHARPTILYNIGTEYMKQRQYSEAYSYLQEALSLTHNNSSLTENKLSILESLTELSFRRNDIKDLENYLHQYTLQFSKTLDNVFMNASSKERKSYWNKNNYFIRNYIPRYALYHPTPNILHDAYYSTILSKSLLLHSDITINQLVYESQDSRLDSIYKAINMNIALRNRYSAITNDTEKLDSIIQILNTQEHELLSLLAENGKYTTFSSISVDSIQNRLNDQEAAIEFVSFKDTLGNNSLFALLLKDEGFPKLFQIPMSNYVTRSDSTEISIWEYFDNELKDINTIYFSPDGITYSIPIESQDSTKEFYRLSSTRELATKNHTISHNYHKAAIYGGIKYDMSVEEMMEDESSYKNVLAQNKTRSISSTHTTTRLVMEDIPYLDGTLTEADNISEITTRNGLQTLQFTGKSGTEASFKTLPSEKVEIVHIATHGFYIQDTLEAKSGSSIFDNDIQIQRENQSLSNCGLLFAGADNTRNQDTLPNDMEDGILTALEISNMDFRGLDMVILSACQTAQGDIMSDGVFGLQRGFKKAGAQSILMSLWPVSDDATCLLMTEFYRNWIEQGKTKHDALELAKQAVRSHTEKGWNNPKYWAAFVLLDAIE
ncbi:MAG: CHAT domain-containing protein [Paludibacteraceae bacterium]|nr:CHAT domain-containing protein [Paludibacteraceae bacterium]